VLGERFAGQPACFDSARRALAHRIEHWGFIASREAYLAAVERCRVVVSTARQEFFGLAVREAIVLGCHPLLPRRLVYPEMVGGLPGHLYDSEDDLRARLSRLLSDGPGVAAGMTASPLREAMRAFATSAVVSRWDEWFDDPAAIRAPE